MSNAPAPSSPARLLLVDDDAHLRESVARGLRRQGFAVEQAEDGRAALNRVQQEHFDLLLLDQKMPGMNGVDVLRLLRATYSQSALPVIMLSGQGEGELLEEALEVGANDFVAKPAPLPAVTARVRSQLARSQAERREKASDPLTGLLTRNALLEQLTALLKTSPLAAAICLDLDGFESVNEGYGTATGDAVLRQAGLHLAQILSGRDAFAARLGADEFALILPDTPEAGAAHIAELLLSTLAKPMFVHGRALQLTASAGIAVAGPGANAHELLGDAGLALLDAKRAGHGLWRTFEPALKSRVASRLSFIEDLRAALAHQQLLTYYQPQVDLRTGAVAGFECLLRWQHPQLGWVPPSEIIPVAEDTGLIVPLGSWVLEHAAHQLAEWQRFIPSAAAVSMSVNVSARQLQEPGLAEHVERVVAQSGLAPGSLRVELTESSLLAQPEEARRLLNQLRLLKIGVELDDFGTGYASFSYLQSLPFDCLKIDRSFITPLDGAAPEPRTLLASMVDMAHTLGMKVIAEGIETEAQLAVLRDLGCDVGQGYLLGKPLPAREAEQLLRRGGAW